MAANKETVVIVRKPKVDKLKPASGPTSEVPVSGCYVLPRANDEGDGGWVQVSGFTVIAPKGTDIRADDLLRIRGEVYAVVGVPGVYPVKKGLGVIVTTERVAKVGT